MRVLLATLLVLLALLSSRPCHAQMDGMVPRMDPRLHPAAAPLHASSARPVYVVADSSRSGPSEEWLALAGVVGGGVGLVGGMAAGALAQKAVDGNCTRDCSMLGIVLGGLAGEALGMSAGVHLANGRRGSLPLGMLTSAGILTVGLVAGNNIPIMLLLVPVGQLIGTVTVERRTGRR
jgi:hypothetical protein